MSAESPQPKEAKPVSPPPQEDPSDEGTLLSRAMSMGSQMLQRASLERKPGLAKLPEKTDEQKLLEGLSPEQKLQLLEDFLKEQQEKPLTKKQELAFLKVKFLQVLTDELSHNRMLVSPGLRFEVGAGGKPYEINQWFQQNQSRLVINIITDENFNLASPAGIPEEMQKAIEHFSGIKLENIKTEADVYAQYNRIVAELRSAKEYDRAQTMMEEVLAPELAKGREQMSKKQIDEIRAQADRKIYELYHENQEAWRAAFREQFQNEFQAWHKTSGKTAPPDISEERVEKAVLDYYASLRGIAYEHEANKRAAGYMLEQKSKVPSEKRAIHAQYMDMLDPKREWTNLRDEQWDTIVREMAINLPLILASGSVASLARRGLSEATIKWLAENGGARRLHVLLGKKFAEKTLFSKVVSGTARVSAGMLTEGLVFDATHHALSLDMYRDLPDWGRSVLWSSVTLGAFHGTGKATERMLTKTVQGMPVNTWLGDVIGGNITNNTVREAVRTLALKGHTEAATLLVVGAMQHGAYKGSLDEFWQNIGDEVLHAYVTVMGLKAGGKLAEKIQKLGVEKETERKANKEREAKVKEAQLKLEKVKEAQLKLEPEYIQLKKLRDEVFRLKQRMLDLARNPRSCSKESFLQEVGRLRETIEEADRKREEMEKAEVKILIEFFGDANKARDYISGLDSNHERYMPTAEIANLITRVLISRNLGFGDTRIRKSKFEDLQHFGSGYQDIQRLFIGSTMDGRQRYLLKVGEDVNISDRDFLGAAWQQEKTGNWPDNWPWIGEDLLWLKNFSLKRERHRSRFEGRIH